MKFFNNEIFFHNGSYLIHSQGFCKTCYFKGNRTCNLPRTNNIYFACHSDYNFKLWKE